MDWLRIFSRRCRNCNGPFQPYRHVNDLRERRWSAALWDAYDLDDTSDEKLSISFRDIGE